MNADMDARYAGVIVAAPRSTHDGPNGAASGPRRWADRASVEAALAYTRETPGCCYHRLGHL